jgi:hypothetical protein
MGIIGYHYPFVLYVTTLSDMPVANVPNWKHPKVINLMLKQPVTPAGLPGHTSMLEPRTS